MMPMPVINVREFHGAFARPNPGELLGRSCDPAEPAKSGISINASNRPATQKRWMLGEKGKKAQDGDNLELDLVAPMRHALRPVVKLTTFPWVSQEWRGL